MSTTDAPIPPAPEKPNPADAAGGAAAAAIAAAEEVTKSKRGAKAAEAGAKATKGEKEPRRSTRSEPAPDEPPADYKPWREPDPTAEDAVTWLDEVTVRGRVITAVKGEGNGPTTSVEEVLKPGKASDKHAEQARARLRKRLGL